MPSKQTYPGEWADDEVRPFRAWCEVCNFSPATGRQVIKAGQGPVITRLSDQGYVTSMKQAAERWAV